MSQDLYNWVYKELVQGPNDVVGALAYVLYKQQKVAFLEKIRVDHSREPSSDELNSFHTYTRLPDTLQGFKDRAAALADEFLEVALETKLQQAESLIRQSVTIEEIKGVKADINNTVGASEQLLNSKLDTVISELTGQKGWLGWFKDIGSNLATTFGTILLIGALITGYKWIGSWVSKAEEKSGVATATADKPDSKPASIPAAAKPETGKPE